MSGHAAGTAIRRAAHFQASFSLFSLWRLALCGSVLLLPTALMGATLPIASRLEPSARGLLGVQLALAAGLMILPTLGLGAVFRLARTHARLGDRRAAIALLEEFLEAHPDRPWAIGYLSELDSEGGDAARGRLLAGRYVALTGRAWESLLE